LPGQYHDRETNLYYNRHRYYDPKIGAYINQDPIGLRGGLNLSKYSSNPLLQTDPLGLAATSVQSGNTITVNIDINLNGQYATPDLAAKWQGSINSAWNAGNWKYHNCNVVFNAQVGTGNSNAANQITVGAPGTGNRSFVNGVGGNSGTWYADDDSYVPAHETGHLMGLDDHYKVFTDADGVLRSNPDPGWAGDIMGQRPGNVSQRDVNSILASQGKLDCKC
jgi:RHS repeat-associated protein